jgi:hypothetical protein
MRTSLTVMAGAMLVLTACTQASVVATGLPYNRASRQIVLKGAHRASCIIGRSSDGGVWLSCPRRRGGFANVRFVNEQGGLTAICEDRSPEYCSRIATQVLSIGSAPIRVRIIR